ncbi:MAG: hypothetical protein CMJ34_07405 [Phycisphaerae bacterium]|nr:hypothetical protein [Phycisphaerae bacterium]
MHRFLHIIIVLGSVFASANSNIAMADPWNGGQDGKVIRDIGRFDRQIDGVGACRALALWTPGPGEDPVVLLVDEGGSLVGGPHASDMHKGLRDVAVSGDGVVVVGGHEGISVHDVEQRPGRVGWWSPPLDMPVGSVSVGGDPVRVLAIGAPGTSEDGTVVAFDPRPDGDGEFWRLPRAYPGARGLVVLPDGSTWIADTDRHRIVKLDPAGLEVRTIGDRGAFPGLFNTPVDLAVHGDRLYVADHLNHRVSVHRVEDGAFLSQWGMHAVKPREGAGRIHYPEGVSLSPDGDEIFVLEPFERRYQVFGRLEEGEDAAGAGLPQRLGVESHFGTDIAADGDWLAMWEPEGGVVLVFNTAHGIPLHLSNFTSAGPPPAGVGRLASIAVDGERGEVWLVDAGHRRLSRWQLRPERPGELVFDPFMGRLARGWSYRAIEEGLAEDRGDDAWIDLVDAEVSGGRVHLLDAAGPAIIVTDRTLGIERVVPLPGGIRPSQFAATGDGRDGWVVIDPDAGQAWSIDPEGAATSKSLRSQGIERPFGIVVTDDGFAVSDRATDRIVMLDGNLDLTLAAGETGVWDGALWRPVGLASLPGGAVAVVDQGNHRAQAFDPATGDWRMTFSLGQGHDRPMLLKEDFMPGPIRSESEEVDP